MKNKKKLYILICICLVSALLAGCAQAVEESATIPKDESSLPILQIDREDVSDEPIDEPIDESETPEDTSTEEEPDREMTDPRRVITEKDFPEYGYGDIEDVLYTAYPSQHMEIVGSLREAMRLLEGEDVLYRVLLLIGGDFTDRTVETEQDLQNQLTHLDARGISYRAVTYDELQELCETDGMYCTPCEYGSVAPVRPRWIYTADLSREDMDYLREQGGFAAVCLMPVVEPQGEGKLAGWLVEEIANADSETLIETVITLTTVGFEKPSVISFEEMQSRIKEKLGWNPDSIRGQGAHSNLTHEEVDAYYELLNTYYRLIENRVKGAFLQELQTEIDGMFDGRGAYIDGYEVIVKLTAEEIRFLETLEKVKSISLANECRTANIKRLMALPDREWDDRFGVMPYDTRIEWIEAHRQEWADFFEEPSEDEPITNTAYDWDFQKGRPVFAGYYDPPEEYLSTGVFGLAGLPYNEAIEWARCRAEQQEIDILFHVSFETEFDLSEYSISAEYTLVEKGKMLDKQYHTDLSMSDMLRLHSLLGDVYFTLCDCGATETNANAVKLWWNTPEDEPITNTAYDWDFAKGWPVFVFSEKDLEQFRLRTWPACEFPHGSAEWNYVAKAFDGEEILIHAELCVNEKQKAFMQSLGIPYETVASDADYVHLDLSYADAVKLIDLMYEAGLCMEYHPNMFGLCDCDDLNNKTNTVSPKLPEDEPITNTAYDWDFQKGWPVFMFREEDLNTFLTWAWPEWMTPYGDPQWEYVVKTFKGEELLFHVSTIERDGKTEELLQSLEIPYQSCKEDGIKKLHLNLSYADTVKLVGLMYQAGLVESEDAMVFYLCLCGNPCGETNVVSPELTYRF